jgi:hypothetical protein
MAKEVFDQAQPRSVKAQRFADAFTGCDEWVVPPKKRRRQAADAIFDVQAIRLPEPPTDFRRAA